MMLLGLHRPLTSGVCRDSRVLAPPRPSVGSSRARPAPAAPRAIAEGSSQYAGAATATPRASDDAAATSGPAMPHHTRTQHAPPRAPLSHGELLSVARQFVAAWFDGIARGPEVVIDQLQGLLMPGVRIEADGVRRLEPEEGIGEVLAELERSHLEYPRSEHRPLLFAASEAAQRAYALVEGRYQDVGALPGHPATFRVTTVYHIFVLEAAGTSHSTVPGDAAAVSAAGQQHSAAATAAAGGGGGSATAAEGPRVGRLWLLRQLTEEDKDQFLNDPVHCYPAPFPKEALSLAGPDDRERVGAKLQRTVRRWWESWSSHHMAPRDGAATEDAAAAATASADAAGAPPAAAAGAATLSPAAAAAAAAGAAVAAANGGAARPRATPGEGGRAGAAARRAADAAVEAAALRMMDPSFRLFDAYGIWRSMQSAPGEGGSGTGGGGGSTGGGAAVRGGAMRGAMRGGRRGLGRDSALYYMQKLKRYYSDVRVEVLDVAVAEGNLATFTHWRARFTPRGGGAPVGALIGAALPVARPGPPAALADSVVVEGAEGVSGRPPVAERVASALPRVQQAAHQQLGGEGTTEEGAAASGGEATSPAQQAAAAAAAAAQQSEAPPSRPRAFELEGVEVDVFNEQLLLQAIWIFRSALDVERPLLLAQQRAEQRAASEAAAAAEEALRAERRAQREEQLQELLSWAQAGQQHFESYVSHLKKQIARHRGLLAGRLAGGSRSDGTDSEDG